MRGETDDSESESRTAGDTGRLRDWERALWGVVLRRRERRCVERGEDRGSLGTFSTYQPPVLRRYVGCDRNEALSQDIGCTALYLAAYRTGFYESRQIV
jgi:hypothetical protein